jgi:ankyrin repeat protein
MRAPFAVLLIASVATGAASLSTKTAAQAPATVEFARDIQPLLREKCYGCHGPALQSGNFRLDRRRDSLPNRVGANGARIVPGNSAGSRLFIRVAGDRGGLRMPPSGALPPEEIDAIRRWIDQGAEWPDALDGERPTPPADPAVSQLLTALRLGDRRQIDRVLARNPGAARGAGTGGVTPLMQAALSGDIASMRRLLDMRADANATNDAGATALMWAVDDVATTRLLLDRGADPNARSMDGRTALVLAAGRAGASDVVRLLLDRGARLEGQTPLVQAGEAADPETIRLLLQRGAATNGLPPDLGLRSGCADCATLFLRVADQPALSRALLGMARYGDSASFSMLLSRGAEPSPPVLRAAAASEASPHVAVAAMLARGIRDEQAFALASRHGDTTVVAALRDAGVSGALPPAPALRRPAASRSTRAAIEASVPLLQRGDTAFVKTAGCISCHHNSLFEMTAAAVRQKGFELDPVAAREQTERTRAYLESWRERVLQDIGIPGQIDTTTYILVGLASARYPADAATDALARYVMRRQLAGGSWRIASHRPPIESSSIGVTALAVRALQAYAPAAQRGDYDRAVRRAATWLAGAAPVSTEDFAFVLLGLRWARGDQATLAKTAQALLARQRDDGGWSQIPTLGSDAYATGQALTALAESGAVGPSDARFAKGVRFLLDTQLADGSWYVRTRVIPVQPYFDSGFPHEADQFISAAATNWATLALAASLPDR